jgi:hypothetical protein
MVHMDDKVLTIVDPNFFFEDSIPGDPLAFVLAQLQWCEVLRALMLDACRTQKTATMRLFASYAWPSWFRIEF